MMTAVSGVINAMDPCQQHKWCREWDDICVYIGIMQQKELLHNKISYVFPFFNVD